MPVCVSVAIPTYQRSVALLGTLQSIIAQETDSEFEVLVLDNGCDMALQAEVDRIAKQAPISVRYLPVPEIGLHNGRHAGVAAAQGDNLVFVDDDIIAQQGWLQAIADAFDDPVVHLVGGRNLPRYETEPPSWLAAFWRRSSDGASWCGQLSLLDYGDKERRIDPAFIWGLNYSIRKKTLLSLGGFHPDGLPWGLRRYRGDGESAVSREAKRAQLTAVYQPKALVYHVVSPNRLTVEYFERRGTLQGISHSYASIRMDNGLGISGMSDRKSGQSSFREMKRYARALLRSFSPDPYKEIKFRVDQAYEAGYKFHQNEVRNDPRLLEWVLKENYWDGRLPAALA
jgi:glycosyltransferase involved in cell wall biosynthesis